MKLEQRGLIEQAFASEVPCLGAVFCSYTFDPTYFEEEVLRTVLRLDGDPQEDGTRYYEEARATLQEVPVACFVDAAVRERGQRLPYDVHLVRRRTFHPKVFLLVYESNARLVLGSGNITRAGLERNTELFFFRELKYDNAADVALLLEVSEFLRECCAVSAVAGTQFALVRQALANRLKDAPRLDLAAARDVRFVSSFGECLLERLREVMHPEAKLTRVGVLAPFFERDDLGAAKRDDGMGALLSELLTLRPAKKAVLDLGVPWDDAPIASPATAEAPTLEDGVSKLWAWRRKLKSQEGTSERVEYFVVTSLGDKRIEAINSAGSPCRLERIECERAIVDGALWPVSPPVVHAPRTILEQLDQEHSVRLWLHPSSELSPDGRVLRRPLHAKAVLVTTVHRGRAVTHALLGSANASRAALGLDVEHRGNVEACVLCRFDGEVTLQELLPALVSYRVDAVKLAEREFPAQGIDLSAWLEEVVHDAKAETLEVKWRSEGPAPLGDWQLLYLDRVLSSGVNAPSSITAIADFTLDPGSAEVTLKAAGGTWSVPIRVLDLAALPTNPLMSQLGLRELLALLGRRVGYERLATMRTQRGVVGVSTVLDAIFGEGFGPTDVFKAWWGAMEELKQANTIAAFERRLRGPTGPLTAWGHLREVPDDAFSRDEIWLFGCELLRELRGLELSAGPDTQSKQVLLTTATDALLAELVELAPGEGTQGWLSEVARFYEVGGQSA